MSDIVQVHGLYVPACETHRFKALPVVDNMPDLDVTKVKDAIKFCRRTDTALDIGAHVGATAITLSRAFRRVVAFEAIAETFDVLKKNTEGTAVECMDLAVANNHGELSFEFLATHSQLSHVLLAGEKLHFEGSTVVGPLTAVPLDVFGFKDVALLKVDVEGTELDVLQGAKETILRCKPIILVEQGGNEAKFHGRARDEGAAFLEGLGMTRLRPFAYNDDRLYEFQ